MFYDRTKLATGWGGIRVTLLFVVEAHCLRNLARLKDLRDFRQGTLGTWAFRSHRVRVSANN